MIADVEEGRVEATEKIDGQSMTFSWIEGSGLRIARCLGDITKGGMDAHDLGAKFHDRPWIAATFVSAFFVLEKAVRSLTKVDRSKIFNNGNFWFNIEVVFEQNPNVIHYDRNGIVFHANLVFCNEHDGKPKKLDGENSYELGHLLLQMPKMKEAVEATRWKLDRPVYVQFPLSGYRERLFNLKDELQYLAGGFIWSEPIREYLRCALKTHVEKALNVYEALRDLIIERSLEQKGCHNLTLLKTMVTPSQVRNLVTFIEGSEKLVKDLLRPFEIVVQKHAAEMLRDQGSNFLDRAPESKEDLRVGFRSAIKEIRRCGTAADIEVLETNLKKLESFKEIDIAMEGIVFRHGGTLYKMTGSFAPVNQIMGILRYSRTGKSNYRPANADQLRSEVERMLKK